jgi:type VI secretion system protein ImpK
MKTIVEICSPLFKWVYDANADSMGSNVQSLKTEILHTFCVVEENIKGAGISDAVWQDIKFVLSAFLDEMILKRDDACAIAWSKESLQMQFFKENLGGERFFERLSYLQKFSDKRFDLLELFYWCLELGYEGKYHHDDDAELTQIRKNLRLTLEQNHLALCQNIDFLPAKKTDSAPSLGHYLKKKSIQHVVLWVLLGAGIVHLMQWTIVDYLLGVK